MLRKKWKIEDEISLIEEEDFKNEAGSLNQFLPFKRLKQTLGRSNGEIEKLAREFAVANDLSPTDAFARATAFIAHRQLLRPNLGLRSTP